ncbi:Protein-glutamate methylesterase/protein-glutamine glutaminase [Desulfonema limicola]|uniref:Protein-glutamate methylesterase/protein-glutamine glutaminase n=1 Tax=Desulfonema limicola TaxID=45656 RepID=A0A975BDW3_9BACT|nr:chemotaxis response regulator protein-glutamate methylesterase [Desulfonema limicola]QTA83722.1 Protein-glutamate methylesterase/protein-glutamine glutaminase [Desulfonema limicola]
MNHQTKILIVDDSRIFRSIVEKCLADENDIKVIGSVHNGFKAIEFIRLNRPDLVTLDLQMPDMDGLETLKLIQEENTLNQDEKPVGVIMLSAFTKKDADITIKALEAGAFDFIAKPEESSARESLNILQRQLIMKIRFFASRRIAAEITRKPLHHPVYHKKKINPVKLNDSSSSIEAILIGVSTGGPRALIEIMPELCEKTDLPIFIVQHMPPTFTASLAQSLNTRCSYIVKEGKHNEKTAPGCAYIAPGGRHMLVRRQGSDVFIAVNDHPPEIGCRPSVNVLFRSALSVFGKNIIAIIMTGMGNDGSEGIKALKRAGAAVIAQDEATSVVWGMPGSAVATGCVDRVVPLHEIPGAVSILLNSSGKK